MYTERLVTVNVHWTGWSHSTCSPCALTGWWQSTYTHRLVTAYEQWQVGHSLSALFTESMVTGHQLKMVQSTIFCILLSSITSCWLFSSLVGTDIQFEYRYQNRIMGRTGMDNDYDWLLAGTDIKFECECEFNMWCSLKRELLLFTFIFILWSVKFSNGESVFYKLLDRGWETVSFFNL